MKRKNKGPLRTPDGVMTYRQAAKFYNIPVGTIAMRRALGKSDHECVSQKRLPRNKIYITHEGKRKALTDVVAYDTIEYMRAFNRRARGAPDEQLFVPVGMLTYNKGYCLHTTAYGIGTVYQLSHFIDIHPRTLLSRRRYFWTDDEIFNTPLFGVRGKQFIIPRKEYERKKHEVIRAHENKKKEGKS